MNMVKLISRVKYRNRNRYGEFLSAAKTISKKISQIDGVFGILATGGLGRGYCDDYSDLDLIIYVDDNKVKEIEKFIAIGFLMHKGISIDTPVVSYQKAKRNKSPSRYWSQVMRWDRENSQVLFDPNDRIKDMLKKKLVFPVSEQKRLLRKHRREAEEYLIYNFETWEKRGELTNVAHALIHAAESIILWIYAKNKKFQPYLPKWLFYHLENDFVSESKYFEVLKRPYLKPIKTLNQARKMRKELLKLCEKIGLKFKYKTVGEMKRACKNKWKMASEKTKYYLSW